MLIWFGVCTLAITIISKFIWWGSTEAEILFIIIGSPILYVITLISMKSSRNSPPLRREETKNRLNPSNEFEEYQLWKITRKRR